MATTKVQDGNLLTLTAPSGGVVKGKPVKINNIIVVSLDTAAEGATFVGEAGGVWDLTAEGAGSGQALAIGAAAYWDDTEKRITATSSGNTKVGVATAAKLTADTTARIRMNPNF